MHIVQCNPVLTCLLQSAVPDPVSCKMSYRIIFLCKFCTGSVFFSIVLPDRCLATNSVLVRCPFAQQQDFLECTIHKQAGHLLLSLLSACDGRTWPPGLPDQLFSNTSSQEPNIGPQIPYARLRGPNTKYMLCLWRTYMTPKSNPVSCYTAASKVATSVTWLKMQAWLGWIGQWTLHLAWHSKNFKEAWMGFSDILR